MKCLYPGCEEKVSGRGLCGGHYNMALKLVKAGKTSWEQLEVKGKSAAPTGPRRREAVKAAWFLENGVATNEDLLAAAERLAEEEPMEGAP